MNELNHLSLGQQLGELTQAIRNLTPRVAALEEGMKNANGVFNVNKGVLIGAVLMAALLLNKLDELLGFAWSLAK